VSTYDAIIFDMDGVLLDTSLSFTLAAVDAAREATGTERFTAREVQALKAIRGFNNDWHVAVAGGAWAAFRPEVSFAAFARQINAAGGGLAGLRTVMGPDLNGNFEMRLTQLAQEAYGGLTACPRLYGFEPQTIRQPGRWRAETPLLSPGLAESLGSRKGIVSGRSQAEMELAFELLGWRLSPERVAVSDDPAFDKPNPVKLLGILGRMGSRRTLFVGDAWDDLELARNAREKSRLEIDFAYVGPAPCPWPEVEMIYPDVSTLLKTVEVTYDETTAG